LRLAVVGTPRSGNTWLRRLLATAYGLEERAVHTPVELDWDRLPARVAIQLHWPWSKAFRDRLAARGLRIIVPARDPLDVLLSILHFAPHEPQTARWLDGAGGSESTLLNGALPTSRAFLEYAVGPRAAALLDVSQRWWDDPTAHRSRYEDLVRDPIAAIGTLADSLGQPLEAKTLAAAAEANTLARLRTTSTNHHFWQGRPGLWRALLPPAEARLIARTHRDVFATLGYTCDPDEALDQDRAEALWIRLRQRPTSAEVRAAARRLETTKRP
jgi:hypothetical protein